MRPVYVIGTCDTKGEELRFACACVERAGSKAILVDVSTARPDPAADVKAEQVAAFHPGGRQGVLKQSDRGVAVAAMGEALKRFLLAQDDIGAVLGLGGSGNTAIVTEAMRALPVGVPKIMVSTLASGNIASFVGPTDIAMMHAVVDVAGLNDISRTIISNAAHAAAGMALNATDFARSGKPALGFTMFGVTTPCITQLRAALEPAHESFVFHATGTGGQSFEKLAESCYFDAVFDMTTTEVADLLVGGTLACTEDRFGAFIREPVPYLGSLGACDMVNFGARATVPEHFHHRHFHIHNPHVTLMRTTVDENRRIGQFIVQRLNRMAGPVRFFLPLHGLSALDAEGQAFHDPAANAALFEAIRKGWAKAPNRQLISVEAHINDETFVAQVLDSYHAMIGAKMPLS